MISWQQALQNRPQPAYEPTTREIAQIHQAWAQQQLDRLQRQQLENPRGPAWMSVPTFQQAVNRFGDWADRPDLSRLGATDGGFLGNLMQQAGIQATQGFRQGMQKMGGMGGTGYRMVLPQEKPQFELSPYERNRLGTIANRTMEIAGPGTSGAGYNAGMSPQGQAYKGGTSGAGYNLGMSPGAGNTEQDWGYIADRLANMGYPV